MKVLEVARFEYITRIRSKWFIIGTFVAPVIILGISLFSGVLAESNALRGKKSYVIIDETNHFGDLLVQHVESQLDSSTRAHLQLSVELGPAAEYESQLRQMVMDGSLDGFLVIPRGFRDSLEVRFYAKNVESARRNLRELQTSLSELVQQEKARELHLDSLAMASLFRSIKLSLYDVQTAKRKSEKEIVGEFMVPFAVLFLLFMAIFTGSQLLMRAVIQERSSRIIEVLLSTVSHNELMTGKILGLGALGLTQVGVYILGGWVVASHFGLQMLSIAKLSLFLIYMVLGYLLYAAIYISIGSMFDSEQEAQHAVQGLSFIAVIPLMLWMLVLESPNSLLVNILCFLPPVTPYFMVLKIAIGEAPWWEIVGTIVVLAVTLIFTIRAAARIFRTAILMYGKRPTLPEIWRWLRAGERTG